MAGVVDEGLYLHLSAVFQNDVRELALCRAEDEQSQVPGWVAGRWLRHKQPLGVPSRRRSPRSPWAQSRPGPGPASHTFWAACVSSCVLLLQRILYLARSVGKEDLEDALVGVEI